MPFGISLHRGVVTMSTGRKRGRPSKYTPELATAICERLSRGESLRSICRDEGMPDEATVRQWALDDYQGFYSQYARARDLGLDAMADEVLAIADTDAGEDVQRSRLRFDARRWYLSKLAPKRYGERLGIEQAGGGPLQVRFVPPDE